MIPWSPNTSPEAAAASAPYAQSKPRSLLYLDAALLGLVVALTFFIRVWDLRRMPANVMPDEADYLTTIYPILVGHGKGIKFFEFTWDWSQTASNTYLQAAFVSLFGLEDSLFGVRMATVVMSTLAAIPFFLLLKRSFGRWTALFSTLLFSSGYWHLNLSRTAWINTFVLFYGLTALLLLELALDARGWRRALPLYALSGVFTSLCVYGYGAGKVLALGILLYAACRWLLALLDRRRTRTGGQSDLSPPTPEDDPTALGELAPRFWGQPPPRPLMVFAGGLTLAAVAAILFLPQVPAILRYWDNYIDRPKAVSIYSARLPYEGALTMEDVYKVQVRKVFDGWVLMKGLEQVSIGQPVRYGPARESFVDPATRVLYMAGLLLSLLTFRRSLPWWFFWLLGLIITQVLTTGIPDGARAVVIIPSVYFFVACSIYWLLRAVDALAKRLRTPWVNRIFLALAAVACTWLVVYNVQHYWNWMQLRVTTDARQPSIELDEFEEWQYLQWEFTKRDEHVFTVDHWHAVRESIPYGLVASYYRSTDWKGLPALVERGKPLGELSASPVTGPEPFSVRWKGLLRAPKNGEYGFGCTADGTCEVRIEDATVLKHGPNEAEIATTILKSGLHKIEILYAHHDPRAEPSVGVIWVVPGAGISPIPIEMLVPYRYALKP